MAKLPMSKVKYTLLLFGFMFLAYVVLSLLYPEHSEKFAKGFQILWSCLSLLAGGPLV